MRVIFHDVKCYTTSFPWLQALLIEVKQLVVNRASRCDKLLLELTTFSFSRVLPEDYEFGLENYVLGLLFTRPVKPEKVMDIKDIIFLECDGGVICDDNDSENGNN